MSHKNNVIQKFEALSIYYQLSYNCGMRIAHFEDRLLMHWKQMLNQKLQLALLLKKPEQDLAKTH